MASHVHATPQQSKSTAFSGTNAPQQHSTATAAFTDNRPEAVAQLKLQEAASDSPLLQQQQVMQQKAANFGQPVVQRVSLNDQEMTDAGFEKYKAGARWQYNYPGGVHISPIRYNSEINDFHVVLRTKGKKHSRLDYKESKTNYNTWAPSSSKLDPAHKPREREMRGAAIHMVRTIFQGTIADLPRLPGARSVVTPTPVTVAPAPTSAPVPVIPTESKTPVVVDTPATGTGTKSGTGGHRSGGARRKARKGLSVTGSL